MSRRGLWKEVLDTAGMVIIAALIALVIRTVLAEPFRIDGPSMLPTLVDGEFTMIEKVTPRFGGLRRGDIVMFFRPGTRRIYVKRVVAVGGDTVRMVGGRLFVNGTEVAEPYLEEPGNGGFPEVHVPDGHVYVLGDNRTHSEDSRFFGPVPVRDIRGRIFLVWWPPGSVRLMGWTTGG